MTGLYVHIPFCNQICPYCDFYKMVVSDKLKTKYIDALINEMKLKDLKKKEINTLYIGGGTPSSLSLYLTKKLLHSLSQNVNLSKLEEFTFECNPEDITIELLKLLKEYHVTRISIGIQTLNPKFQNLIKRFSTSIEIKNIVDMLHEVGLANYSFDLMYGFYEQSLCDVKNDIDLLTSFNPTHISIYSLIVEERTLFGLKKRNNCNIELNDDEQANIYQFIIDYLYNLGYIQYETSNFAKEGFKSKHNLIYWNSEEYYSLGAGASSYVDGTRSIMNSKIHEYINDLLNDLLPSCVSEDLTFDEMVEEYVMMNFRKNEGINVEKFKNKFSLNFFERFPHVENLIKNNILDYNNNCISINKKYRYVANTIIVKVLMN